MRDSGGDERSQRRWSTVASLMADGSGVNKGGRRWMEDGEDSSDGGR